MTYQRLSRATRTVLGWLKTHPYLRRNRRISRISEAERQTIVMSDLLDILNKRGVTKWQQMITK